ncbi:Uncharacterized protein DPV78_011831 [Talaromyces pinophilus]|nr:Uncharacterized protein DPV78_011831 [Talaromyces pinophilus]
MLLVYLGTSIFSALSPKHLLLAAVLAFILVNLKGLPGIWHLRLFRGLFRQLLSRNPGRFNQIVSEGKAVLFSYLVTTSSNPPIECDYNMHKSNSTFFSDLDINRTELLFTLFKDVLRPPGRNDRPLIVALGGTSCVFKREIKPFERFEIWSRISTWDQKWIYVISYFMKKGHGNRLLSQQSEATTDSKSPSSDANTAILATCMARYVFKRGRKTVPPQEVFQTLDLCPSQEDKTSAEVSSTSSETDIKPYHLWTYDQFEQHRLRALDLVAPFSGEENLPCCFSDGPYGVLGQYTDL